MVNMKKLLSLVLAACMLLGMASVSLAETTDAAEATRDENTLVIGYTEFNEKFSPFYGETAYDNDVAVKLVGEELAVLDRQGAIVFNGIEGETIPFNGVDHTYTGIADLKVERDEAANKTVYTAKLREDVKFSDGTPMTADDLIFTYYVQLDPSYTGPSTLNSYDIVGLKAYQTQTPEDLYAKYEEIAKAIYAAGEDHEWTEGDAWTKELVQDIVNYVVGNYNTADYAPEVGSTPEEITANEGLQVAFGMAMWGFGTYADGVLTGKSGATWNLKDGVYPAIEDYYTEAYEAYGHDPEAFFGTEAVDTGATSTLAAAQASFISGQAKAEPEAADGVPSIAGIKKVDDNTVEVTLNGYEAPAVYQVFGVTVAPLHYYGDKAQYDYENNKFGFPFGDLSIVQSKATQPMGAGPYKFIKYENKVVYLEANENFWKGEPKIKYIQLKETLSPDKVSGVTTGTLDITDPDATAENIQMIKDANGGELEGDSIHVTAVDFLGYGYIGLNAQNISVGGEAGSEASKNLRRALMTALAVYRDVVVDSYYGEIASVINYPISNTSWAAPQKTDADYKVAFSTDVDGNDIYTADMTAEQKDEAALNAIVGFLKAAGYTFDEATGKATAAPEGAQMEYEVLIGGSGTGDHPSFGILTDAKALLEKAGITLTLSLIHI